MFRQFIGIQSKDQIEQIRVHANYIQANTQHKTISSKLAVLMHSIEKFEKHRYLDFLKNNNERALQVLHTSRIFYRHYDKHLVNSPFYHEATQLRDSLIAYEKAVIDHIMAIEADLNKIREPLALKAQAALIKQQIDQNLQKLEAEKRDAMLDEFLKTSIESHGYDFFGLTDISFPSHPLSDSDFNDIFDNEEAIVWVNAPTLPEIDWNDYNSDELTEVRVTIEFDDNQADDTFSSDNEFNTTTTSEEIPYQLISDEEDEGYNNDDEENEEKEEAYDSGETVEEIGPRRNGSENSSPSSPRFFDSPRSSQSDRGTEVLDIEPMNSDMSLSDTEESPPVRRPLFARY